MSLRTRIRGFTHWVNLRLQGRPRKVVLTSVVSGILEGTTLVDLILSLSGCTCEKIGSFDQYDPHLLINEQI